MTSAYVNSAAAPRRGNPAFSNYGKKNFPKMRKKFDMRMRVIYFFTVLIILQ